MVEMRKILVPVDFFPASLTAVKQAIELAIRYSARLTLLHVIEPIAPWVDGVPFNAREIIEKTTTKSTAELNKVAALSHAADVRTEVLVRNGPVDTVIESAVRTEGVDFVVMGTHGRRAIGKFFLGSTTERLLRNLPVPLLAIRHAKPTPQRYRHILVTTDFSEGTSSAIEYAWSLATKYGADMTLLHVLDDVQADVIGSYRGPLLRGIQYDLESLLPVDGGKKCKVQVLIGSPIRRILSMAEQVPADLIVMNIHTKTVMDRLSIGSTAEKIIRAANVPVLAVPSVSVRTKKAKPAR